MAHNIEQREVNGVITSSFVENGRKHRAWHGLGQVYDKPLTVTEALEGAKANFNVGLQPVLGVTPSLESALNGETPTDDMFRLIDGKQYVSIDDLKSMIVDNRKATMRLDYNETLGIVTDSYGVVQYEDAFRFIDILTSGQINGTKPVIECAGLLGAHGERCFVTAKMPDVITMPGNHNDEIEQYLVITSSHDGSGAVTCLSTPVRVVCANTLNYAMQKNTGRLTFKHTTHVMDRLDLTNRENIEMARKTLAVHEAYKEAFEASLNNLSKIRLTDKQTEEVLAKALLSQDSFKLFKQNGNSMNCDEIPTKSKNIITNALTSLHSGVGQDNIEGGTGLWLINGLTTHYQNSVSWKDDEKKFGAITDGSVQKKLQSAYDYVTSERFAA